MRPTILSIVDSTKVPMHVKQSLDLCNGLSSAKFNPHSEVLKLLQQERALLEKEVQLSDVKFKKYLIDLKIASIVDTKLNEYLQKEALKSFIQKQKAKESLLKHIAKTKEEEEKKYLQQGNEYLLEKQRLMEDLLLQVSSLDQLMIIELDKCLKQIEHLEIKIRDIEFQKEKLYENLRDEALIILDRPENHVDGECILAGGNPKTQKEDQKGFLKEVATKHDEIKAMQNNIQSLEQEEEKLENEEVTLKGVRENINYEIIRDKADIENSESQWGDDERSIEEEVSLLLSEFSDSEEDQDFLSQVEDDEVELYSKHSDKLVIKPKVLEKARKEIDQMSSKELKLTEKLAELREIRSQKAATLDAAKSLEYDKEMNSDKFRNPVKVAFKKHKIKIKEKKLEAMDKKIEAIIEKKKEVKQKRLALIEKLNSFVGTMAKAWNMINFFGKGGEVKQESIDKLIKVSPILEKTQVKAKELDKHQKQAQDELARVHANAAKIYDEGAQLRSQYQNSLSILGHRKERASPAEDAVKAKMAHIQSKVAQKPEEVNRNRKASQADHLVKLRCFNQCINE